MNAWEVDPNLQVSVYTGIGEKFILLFNKLADVFGRELAVPVRQRQQLVNSPDDSENSPYDEIDRSQKAASAVAGTSKLRIANFR